jgi:hypothetical protein
VTRVAAYLWPLSCAAFAGCASAAVFQGAVPGLRAVFVLPFLLVCPGMAVVRLLRLPDAAAQIALGLATSVAVAGGVSGILLYAHAWNPQHAFAIIVVLTLAATLADLARTAGGPR